MPSKSTAIAIRVPESSKLPPNAQWENRFEIRSESSDRVYVVAQNKVKRHWACSCPGWRTRRQCKHLESMRLPAHEKPCEVLVAGGG
jgi:hypothetical protein